MNKKKIFALASCIGLSSSLALVGITYAYFEKNFNSNDVSGNTNITSENVIEVSSYTDLYETCTNNKFNDNNKVDDTRKIIRLTTDITLSNNLFMNVDAHIDLNGHILDLNNYTFTIHHSYYGSFMLYNGKIKVYDSSKVIVNTTNSTYLIDNVEFIDNNSTIVDSSSYVKIISIDENYTVYNAFYTIASAFENDIVRRPNYLTYDEFKALNITNFDSSLFISSKECLINNTNETCAYIFDDVNLLTHYLSNDFSIQYVSSSTSVLSNSGKVNSNGNITLSVILSSSKFANNYTCDFIVHVVDQGNLEVGETLIKSYLSDLLVNDSLKINDTLTHDSYYFFTTGRDLPLTSKDASIAYSYKTYLDKECKNEVVTASRKNNGVYVFEPNEDCYFLKVTIKNTANEEKDVILNMYTIYIAKHETVARLILNELYGGSIVYNTAEGPTYLYTIDDIKNNSDSRLKLYAETYKLTNIEYQIQENSMASSDYKIENGYLDIIVDKPQNMKESAVNVKFTFDGNIEITVELYVTYIIGSGGTSSNFLPYYTAYDQKVSSSPSVESFTMPFSYENKAPFTIYDFSYKYDISSSSESTTIKYENVSLSKPDSLNVKLCSKNGDIIQDFTSLYQDGISIVSSFDTFLNGTSLVDFATNNQGAYWEFSFDTSKITLNDLNTLLIYNYKFTNSSSWITYQKVDDNGDRVYTDLTTSIFTINGGLVYSTSTTLENSIRNENLFIYLYNKLNNNDETITSASNKIIINDWFDFDIKIDITEIGLTGNIDINGIQYFTSCSYLNLSNITMNSTKINLISSMDSVETLNISNASISDVNTITNLKNMKNLKTLYINDNNIETFDFLNDLPSLNEVYLYNNTVTLSSFYGSEGMCNYQAYEDLLRKGITVYYRLNNSNTPMAYENTTDLNDYQRLKSIEYQSVLKEGMDIQLLYEKFTSLSASNDFKLDNFTTLTWSYGGGTSSTDATYFYVVASGNSNGVELIVKYYIDRY